MLDTPLTWGSQFIQNESAFKSSNYISELCKLFLTFSLISNLKFNTKFKPNLIIQHTPNKIKTKNTLINLKEKEWDLDFNFWWTNIFLSIYTFVDFSRFDFLPVTVKWNWYKLLVQKAKQYWRFANEFFCKEYSSIRINIFQVDIKLLLENKLHFQHREQ